MWVVSLVAGVNSLCQSLSANPLTASTLTHLDLSGNALRGDDLSVSFPLLSKGPSSESLRSIASKPAVQLVPLPHSDHHTGRSCERLVKWCDNSGACLNWMWPLVLIKLHFHFMVLRFTSFLEMVSSSNSVVGILVLFVCFERSLEPTMYQNAGLCLKVIVLIQSLQCWDGGYEPGAQLLFVYLCCY